MPKLIFQGVFQGLEDIVKNPGVFRNSRSSASSDLRGLGEIVH